MNIQGIESDIKQKPYLLAIPIVGVVAFVFLRNKASATATTTANSAPGSLDQMPATTNVSTDMLATAMQDLNTQFTQAIQTATGQESTDIQNLGTEIAGQNQQITQNQQTTTAAIQQASGSYAQQIAALQQKIDANKSSATGNMNLSASTALQARNRIGDDNIKSTFLTFNLPDWIGLQYVAENKSLPAGVPELEAWLNSHGYRNQATGKFTSLVSLPTPPASVQQEINSAYGTS